MQQKNIHLKQIIKENINKLLLFEYHHAYDNNLYQDAINIGKQILDYRKKGWNGNEPIIFKTNALDPNNNDDFIIYIFLTDNKVSQYHAWNTIKISKTIVDNAIQNKQNDKLLSIIYHELGHLTNTNKAKSLKQIQDKYKEPMLLKLDSEKYQNIMKILYRFKLHEMKARCFETTMFLKQNINNNISLKNVYDNRCSDITLMQNFIDFLKSNIQQNNTNQENQYIITELYNTIYNKFFFNKSNLNTQQMANKLFKHFQKKLLWFKNRIDKIYYDYLLIKQKN